MRHGKRLGLGCLVGTLGLAAAVAAWPAAAEATTRPGTVRIGMVQSLFRDVPDAVARALMQPFGALMRAQTGMNGEMVMSGDYAALARQLEEEKVHLGVFHGVEFAWAREKCKELRPLCIAVNKSRRLRAYVVTRNDSSAADFADLKGGAIALPKRSREHCRLFLSRQCAACGAEPEDFFAKVANHANVSAALDDVLRGKVKAAVVDNVALQAYRQVKPGCYARLRVIEQSEVFPAAVIAYKQGTLDQATLNRFRNGLVSANRTTRGRDMMMMWNLTAFEPVPADYYSTLANILRAYPAPDATARAGRSRTALAAP